jgi:hypothetical protein
MNSEYQKIRKQTCINLTCAGLKSVVVARFCKNSKCGKYSIISSSCDVVGVEGFSISADWRNLAK